MRRLIDILFAYAVLGGLIVLAIRLTGEPGPSLSGQAFVVDGDTLILAGERLRLRGIDAPELAQSCAVEGRAVACGRKARDALRAMVAYPVTCSGNGHDVYGRRLVACRTNEGDVGARLVAAGEAVADGCCRNEEAAARRARRGLWAGTFEQPADWRRSHPRSQSGR